MSDQAMPFYIQTALLDRYIHSNNPLADSDMCELIINLLRTRKDLRRYFFRNRPSPAWAQILWDAGFFDPPPTAQRTENGYLMPGWDVQDYLVSVADQVPDLVLQHIESLQSTGWHKAHAIRALCLVPLSTAQAALPVVIQWLKDVETSRVIATETAELIGRFASEGMSEPAIQLLRELTTPHPSSEVKNLDGYVWGAEAISAFGYAWDELDFRQGPVAQLQQIAPSEVISVLDQHLRAAIEIEGATRGAPDIRSVSWWRTTVEPSDQDTLDKYKDRLLDALRDALAKWVRQSPNAARALIERYLNDSYQIFQRLAIYLLSEYPEEYRSLVSHVLLDRENLDNTRIHHEYFLLLERGCAYLSEAEQKELAQLILGGPPQDRLDKTAEWAKQAYGVDYDGYVSRARALWVRDRLWMIKGCLFGPEADELRRLLEEYGNPEHPAYTHWSSGVVEIHDVSPMADSTLAQLTVPELLSFVSTWQPPSERAVQPEVASYEGLARALAGIVMTDPDKYKGSLVEIALIRPEFAFALLDRFCEPGSGVPIPWEMAIPLCEQLIAHEHCGVDASTTDSDWRPVRRWIVRLLELGLSNPERAIPSDLLGRARDSLLALTNDPDPNMESDRPPEGYFGYNDPGTVAINHVRPSALLALIQYSVKMATDQGATGQQGADELPGPRRLEPVVREALSRMVNRKNDPSLAVHSVFGRRLPALYWLDKEWVDAHIDEVFPEADSNEATDFFVSAWDSFVASSRFDPFMLTLLRDKYERSIANLAQGNVTETHVPRGQGLAVHVVTEYLLSSYDIRSDEGQRSLVATYFGSTSPEDRGSAAWALWRICEADLKQGRSNWARARALWEWRNQEANAAGHSADFDREMQYLAHLLPLAPRESETIPSLRPLLEALLPHMVRPEYPNWAWNSVETYLAMEVERDPLGAIRFYRLMHEQLGRPGYYYSDEARKLVESAANSPMAQAEALSLIDTLARWGDYSFHDIYQRYAR